jgi:hypothetical protein
MSGTKGPCTHTVVIPRLLASGRLAGEKRARGVETSVASDLLSSWGDWALTSSVR